MKIGHVVLFTVAASLISYLNSAILKSDEDDDNALKELESIKKEASLLEENKEEIEDIEEEVSLEEEASLKEDIEDIEDSLKYIGEDILGDLLAKYGDDEPITIEKTQEIEKEEDYDDEILKDIEDLLAFINSKDEEEVEEVTEDEDDFESTRRFIESLLNEEVDNNSEEDEEISEEDNIDKIFEDILKQEGYSSDDEDEYVDDEDAYLDSLYRDLKDALSEDDDVEKEKDIYTQINELYPYLSLNFVRSVYDLKEEIAYGYPLGVDIVLLHRLSFDNLDELRQFTEIVLDHDYRVNVDEGKMIVDIFKIFKNEDGKILTNIFEIANQAKVLNGTYEGYRVELLEE